MLTCEKWRVERAVRHVCEALFAARASADLDDENAQTEAWVAGLGAERPCPEDATLSLGEDFAQVQRRLLALPAHPCPADEPVAVVCGKTPDMRLDLNDRSIPHSHLRRSYDFTS